MSGFVFVLLLLPQISPHADEMLAVTEQIVNKTANKPAENSAVYMLQVDKPVAAVYRQLYKSLEDARFFVVFEPDIGKNLARFSEKWGDDYNRNQLSEIRSMVFCNGWYANKVSNLDLTMLGFCPLHLTMIERDGKTTVLFNRPSVIAQHSPAKDLLLRIENEVIAAIQLGLK